MSFGLFKNNVTHKVVIYKSYTYLIYMYKEELALNNPQGLIHHKTQLTNSNITWMLEMKKEFPDKLAIFAWSPKKHPI